jgi:hypothetical protein
MTINKEKLQEAASDMLDLLVEVTVELEEPYFEESLRILSGIVGSREEAERLVFHETEELPSATITHLPRKGWF